MKNALTTSEIFKYILLFTFLFAAFLALAITYNRVFKLKNETISILEKYEGVSSTSLSIINNYLKNSGYSTEGQCVQGEYGLKDLNTTDLIKVDNPKEKYLYCLSEEIVKNENSDQIYYNVKLFFKFNLPFIGELFTFKISGETKGIKYYSESQRLEENI